MNWIIRKPIWGSLEDPVLDPLKIDLGLGLHNGAPILVTGNRDTESIDYWATTNKKTHHHE